MGNLLNKIKMKFAIAALLFSSASAQIIHCDDNSGCPAELIEAGGCCQQMLVTAIGEDPQFGFIKEGVFKDQDMAVGTATAICFNKAFVDMRAAHGNKGNNMLDLQDFMDANPGIDQALELDDNTVEALMDAWGTDEATNQAFEMEYMCLNNAKKLAMAASAMVAGYMAL